MSFLDEITPLLTTYNDAQNIGRALARLKWARSIVVVDAGSTDGTLQMLEADPRIKLAHRPFDALAQQRNFGLSQITTNWVLSLDADYELSDALVAELQGLRPAPNQMGFRAKILYRIYGRTVRRAPRPSRVVLHRLAAGRYENERHGYRLPLGSTVAELRGAIYQDDRKPLEHWLTSQAQRAANDAYYLLNTRKDSMSKADRIRLVGWPAPLVTFFHVMIVKGVFLDGRAGWLYAFQRVLAELLLAFELFRQRLPANSKFVLSRRPKFGGGSLEIEHSTSKQEPPPSDQASLRRNQLRT